GTVVVTGLLTDVAANAFPGHKRAVGSSLSQPAGAAQTSGSHRRHHRAHHRRSAHSKLSAPAQAPSTATGTSTAAPAATAPAQTATAPAQTATQAAAPPPAPVLSGGS
ncbi:MAG TPA: hypothetical protein VE127_17305, partial [Solirubrobacteraceae bacterium]|nr:hypothetical protein [Solirubrobacteraceae bacterium]